MAHGRNPTWLGPARADKDEQRKVWVVNETAATIPANTIVRLAVDANGVNYVATPAITTTGETGPLVMLGHNIDSVNSRPFASHAGVAYRAQVFEANTSALALGDKVYLSATVAGSWDSADTGVPIGWVVAVGANGRILFDPTAAAGSAAAANLDKYRPDQDQEWEVIIDSLSAGIVHVNDATGNDNDALGTPAKPYKTLFAAIMDIPQNRANPKLKVVKISLDSVATYDLPAALTELSFLEIESVLPAPEATYAIHTPGTYGLQTGNGTNFLTAQTWASDPVTDTHKGKFVRFAGGSAAAANDREGWCWASAQSGTQQRMWVTQGLENGFVDEDDHAGGSVIIYDPNDFTAVRLIGTVDDDVSTLFGADGLILRYVQLQTMQNGGTPDPIHIDNSSLLLDRVYIDATNVINLYVKGHSQLEVRCSYIAPLGASLQGGILLDDSQLVVGLGTVFNMLAGLTATTGYQPVVAAGNSSIYFQGQTVRRQSGQFTLLNNAHIDHYVATGAFNSIRGHTDDLTQFICTHFREASLATGNANTVTGLCPNFYGTCGGTFVIEATGGAVLYEAADTALEGLTITEVSASRGYTASNGEERDGTRIWADRDRVGNTWGSKWGSHYQAEGNQASPIVFIDWRRGTTQTIDFTSPAPDTTGTVEPYFLHGVVGHWHTLILVTDGGTMNYDWTSYQSIDWAGGTPYAPSHTGNKDILRFLWDGQRWYGEVVGLDYQ